MIVGDSDMPALGRMIQVLCGGEGLNGVGGMEI